MTAVMYVPTFYLRQKYGIRNKYELYAADPDGSFGQLMGFAEQKFALKEEVVFFADQTKTRRVFSFRARNVMELNAGYDVFDEAGQQIGFFQKDFGKSILRSTFRLEGPGFQGTGQERSQGVALLRRFTDVKFIPIHFDFVDAEAKPLLGVERQGSLRDQYTVHVPDPRVDFRFAAAVAVAMDAMMQR
ncbi:MAG: hypothetical protein WKF79_10635 [Nocardioides sp.]